MQAVTNGLIGGLLHLDVERGVDAQAAFVDSFGAVGGFEIFADVFEEIRRQVVARILHVEAERRFLGGFFLGGRDFPLFHHLMDHQIAAGQGARGIHERRIDGTADHAGEQRGLLEIQVGDVFAEIKLRGGGKTVVAVGQVDLVGVHGEDLRLGVAALDLQGEEHFLGFAAEAAVAAVKEEIAGELHGDGAGAFGFAVFEDVAIGGAGDAGEVHAPVILEVLVFDGGDGVVEDFGDLLPGHQDAALQGEAADELAVVGVNFGDYVGAISFQRANFGEVAFVNEKKAGGGT